MNHFLDELNPVQRAAASTLQGPVMIIAGAGSGKTRVLTYRIACLIENGTDAFNILALTFTNKAAREMKERIARIVGEKTARNLWMGTFHSVFAKLLRIEADKLGYPHNFTIYDTDDSKSVLREIIRQMNLDEKIYKPSLVLNRISDAKNKLISAQQYLKNPLTQQEDQSSRKPMLGQIYAAYQKANFRAGAMDFDDLLFQTNVLLRDFPDVLLRYQDKFRYILVDEYQDTNFSQYVIIRQMAARFQNICVVGDDAQSIYAFRGANIQNILNFEKDYPDLKKFKLEENYRSTKIIVNAANQVIANNQNQLHKSVFTNNEEGHRIEVIRAGSDNEEGQKIAAHIFETRMQEQAPFRQFAILYRTNAQSRSFEEALRKLNVPYRIYGGISFYQRKEIKDLLSYFRLAINNHDNESLKRIINYPARGIGQSTMDKITVAAAEHDTSLWTVLSNLRDFGLGINSGISTKIMEFVTQIRSYTLLLHSQDAFELANHIAVNSGLVKELYNDKSPEGVSRYENVQELLNGIKDFTEQPRNPQEDELMNLIRDASISSAEEQSTVQENPLKTLDEFMQDISLLTNVDIEDEKEEDREKVSLMTVHSAKGLEFPYVYIVGLEENLFPSQMSVNDRQDLEEERRLFYVAITRAEKKATLSFATMRYRFGNVTYCEPSRFISEIKTDCLDFNYDLNTKPGGEGFFESFRKSYGVQGRFNQAPSEKEPGNRHIAFKPAAKKLVRLQNTSTGGAQVNADIELNRSLQDNDMVLHEKFGKGRIIMLEGKWPDTKALIQFESAGNKSLLLKFARLRKV
ncbi:MAG TPA: 3'-5' exonuclease [Bacteroidia bacterium]|nr:3'-5' exonuclease [Bacteroidia bacterium]